MKAPISAHLHWFITLGLVFMCKTASAQTSTPIQIGKTHKNTVALTTSSRHFFEGVPFQSRNPFKPKSWQAMGLGISYARRLSVKSSVSLSTEFLFISYRNGQVYPIHEGDVLSRWNYFFEAKYMHRLLEFHRFELSSFVGTSFRWGVEDHWIYDYYFETIVEGFEQTDLGAVAGLNGTFTILKDIYLCMSGDFTQYFPVHKYARLPLAFENGKYPTTSVIAGKLGLGFRF